MDNVKFGIKETVVPGYYLLHVTSGSIITHTELKVDVDKKKMNKIIKEINSLLLSH